MSDEPKDRIRNSRKRTNILHKPEFAAIEYFCKVMPPWISSDMLSFIGFLGSIIAAGAVFFATYHREALFFIVPGMFIQWFGDSLDGRIAYYRNQPRKWYGWTLDMSLDWVSTILTCVGYLFYLKEYPLFAMLYLGFLAQMYILAIIRYKITDEYLIDAGSPLGPTEMRIMITTATLVEYFYPGFLLWFGVVGLLIIITLNVFDFRRLIKVANERDAIENAKKAK